MNEDVRDFQGQAVPDPWEDQIFTLADAFKPREPLKYLIEGVLPVGSLTCIYGAPGCLKSMLWADLAISVASGKRWLGRDVIQGPVLWIDFDNGKRRTHERFEAMARGHFVKDDIPLYYVSLPSPWLNAGNVADIEALAKRIIERGIILVIIDNLSLIHPGVDEKDDQMGQIMSHFRQLVESTKAAISLVHHQSKMKNRDKQAREGESIRGHSSIEASVDLALLVNRQPDSNIIKIKSTKTRDMDVQEFGCEFVYTQKAGTAELHESDFVSLEVEDTYSDRAIDKVLISTLISEPRLNQKNLIAAASQLLTASKSRIKDRIIELTNRHYLKMVKGDHYQNLYVIGNKKK